MRRMRRRTVRENGIESLPITAQLEKLVKGSNRSRPASEEELAVLWVKQYARRARDADHRQKKSSSAAAGLQDGQPEAQLEADQALQALLQQAEDTAVYARSVHHQGAPARELATPTLDEERIICRGRTPSPAATPLRFICRRSVTRRQPLTCGWTSS